MDHPCVLPKSIRVYDMGKLPRSIWQNQMILLLELLDFAGLFVTQIEDSHIRFSHPTF